jgi:hypothetical protein
MWETLFQGHMLSGGGVCDHRSVCDPAKIYFTSKFSCILFFATPPIKLKLGQETGGGTTNSKAPGPIITMGQSDTLSNN